MSSSIVASAAKQIGGLLAREAKSLYDVSDKIDCLQRDLQWMHCFLEDADNRQHCEKVVAMWVAEIRDFAYEAEEIVEKYVHQVSHPRQNGKMNTIRWLLCALYDAQALHEVGSNINDLRSRITQLLPRLKLYGVLTNKDTRSEQNLATREQRQTYSHIVQDPVGLQNDTADLVQKLVTNKEVKVVGIWGMGGLGKTTLARQVFQHKDTRGHFKHRVWICISNKFETKQVFREILKELSDIMDTKESTKHDIEKIDSSNLSDVRVPERICEILKQTPCLVVLDDVWEKDDWNALKPAFDSIRSSPSKILITTRNNVLIQDGNSTDEYSHKLNVLGDDDSWKLFQRIAFSDTEVTGESSPHVEIESEQTKEEIESNQTKEVESLPRIEIESKQTKDDNDMDSKKKELGREMLKHCKGLPLAIITVGGVLRSKKSVNEWEDVKKNVASYLMKHGSESKGLLGILEWSYTELPFYLKPCFMYLGHFPEDYNISVDRLYHLWEAEGLVTTPDNDEDETEGMCRDDLAESYLKELVERCLVQVAKTWVNGRISKVRVHDVMRDMCLKKCNEVNFLSIKKYGWSSSSRVDRKLRRCALYVGDANDDAPPFDPSPNSAPCIRSLLVFRLGQDQWRKKCFTSSKTRKSLSLLRVLDLESTQKMRVHPKITEHLIYLRYLSFKGSMLEIGGMMHIWDCKFLETLDLRASKYGETGKFSNKFWKLDRLRHLYLPSAMRLKGWRKLILTDTQLGQIETLINFSTSNCEIKNMRKMTSLRVFSMNRYVDLSMEDVEHLLKSPAVVRERLVKPLHLSIEASAIKEGATSPWATSLKSLIWINGFDITGVIKKDDTLRILTQVHLTKLGLSKTEIGQQGMLLLEKLPYLKRLQLFGKSIAGNKMSFSNGGFPQLKVLSLFGLEELVEWEVGSQGTLPNLETLDIFQCKKLKMIPDGLPKSVFVTCIHPCISGVEKYNICQHAGKEEEDEEEGSRVPFISSTKRMFSTFFSRLHH